MTMAPLLDLDDQALLDLHDSLDDAGRADLEARLTAEEDQRDARLAAPDALARAAGWYAANGIAVFRLLPGGKRPFPGTRGLHDATCDLDVVQAWWRDQPQANIGIPTGHGFDVIDVDGPPGHSSLVDLEPIPTLARARTGSGGLHLYVAATGRGNGARIQPGIDYRGIGGYVVAPPSRHANGRLYRWERSPSTLIEHLAQGQA